MLEKLEVLTFNNMQQVVTMVYDTSMHTIGIDTIHNEHKKGQCV